MRGDEDGRKRKNQKKGQSVPIGELGFKAKFYHGIETQYRRQRTRYKAVKYGAQNSKDCFMGRLRFTLNIAELTAEQLKGLSTFKGIKRQQWGKVRQIVYHAKEELHCAICLETRFQAPQMTSCGHVFCWHCILMHFYKSLKACFCPVCNQSYELPNVVSCHPIYTRSSRQNQQSKVSFALKARRDNDNRIYDPDSLEEDVDFARVVRATPEKILQIFQEERQIIEQNIKQCDDQQIKGWMEKVHSLSWERIEKAQQWIGKKQTSHYLSQHHRKEHISNGYIYSILDEKERAYLTTFYQAKNAQLTFLHPICDKYLRKGSKQLPRSIEQNLVYWEEAEYNTQLLKKYKQISHVTINQQIDLPIINIEKIIDADLSVQFQEELSKFNERRKQLMARQDRESERLSVQYEQQKQYMAKLKKMEESQFYDIKLPTTIDISELNNAHFFPSLIEARSSPERQEESTVSEFSKHETEKKNKRAKKAALKIEEGDFPELFIKQQSQRETISHVPLQIPATKSQQIVPHEKQEQFPNLSQTPKPLMPQNQKKKNKKQKFVNVTQMFFRQQEEDDYS